MELKDIRCFIPVNGKLVEVSEELYRAYYRPLRNTGYHVRKNGECCCANEYAVYAYEQVEKAKTACKDPVVLIEQRWISRDGRRRGSEGATVLSWPMVRYQ